MDNILNNGISLSRTFTGQGSGVLSVAYAPSMKQAISGSKDGSIMIWNFKPSQRAYRLRGHLGAVHSVAMAPNESIIASGSADRTVRLWKPTIRGQYKELKAHAGEVLSVRFSDDSQYLATGGSDKMIKMWDLKAQHSLDKPKFASCIHGHRNWVRSVDLSKGSYRMCSGSDDKLVKIWDVPTSTGVGVFDDHTSPVRSVRFDSLSGVAVASSGDGAIMLHDIRSEMLVQHYELQTSASVNSIEFHTNGNYLLSGSSDGALRVWDLREGRLLYTVSAHTKSVNSCAFSSDGNHFISGSLDSLVLAWRCESLSQDLEDYHPEDVIEADYREPKPEKTRKHSTHVKKKHQHHHRNHEQSTKSSRRQSKHSKKDREEKHHKPRRSSKARRGSSKHQKKKLLDDEQDGDDKLEMTNNPSKANKPSSIGEFTKAAARASMKNRMASDADTDTSSRGALPAAPPPVDHPIGTLARAMQNLEQRLRLNEDAIAELRLSSSQVTI